MSERKPHPLATRRETPCPKCGGLWNRPLLILDMEATEAPVVSACAHCKHYEAGTP